MPGKSGRQTPQEQRFIAEMVRINDPAEAARRAGYQGAAGRGHELMRRPAIVAEVQARITHRLQTEGYEVGVGTLIDIARDTSAPKAPRVMAAKALVELSKGADRGDRPKELHEMNRAELAAAADQARAYLAELERPTIEGEVVLTGGVFD